MKCQQFREFRIEIARDLPLEAGLKLEAIAHAEHCPSCKRLLTAERSLQLALTSLHQKSETGDAPLQLESRIVKLFRENVSASTITGNSGLETSRNPSWHRRPWILAVAALFLLAVSLLGLWIGPSILRYKNRAAATVKKLKAPDPSSKSTTEPAVMAQSPTMSQGIRVPSLIPKKEVSSKRPGHRIASIPAAHSQKKMEESKPKLAAEPVTDFIEVSPLEDIYPPEIRQVVRVRLSRGSLTRFGFPVNVERIYEPVQADLLLSQEGWVKAVRFVK